jgi:hypothetical protein
MKILQFRFFINYTILDENYVVSFFYPLYKTPPSTFFFNFGKYLCNNGIENYWEKFLLKEVIMILKKENYHIWC